MEQIYSSLADLVAWIESKYGTATAWIAAVLAVAISIGAVSIALLWTFQ